MQISKASASWQGVFKDGKGTMKPAHGGESTFTAGSRFEGQAGSNPEELLGAALAGCYTMALTLNLEKAGMKPTSVNSTADVTLEKLESTGQTVTTIALVTKAVVPGADAAKFQEVAEATKKGCPISRALNPSIKVNLNATVSG
jgi:osmotically inducible protein OsmC